MSCNPRTTERRKIPNGNPLGTLGLMVRDIQTSFTQAIGRYRPSVKRAESLKSETNYWIRKMCVP